MPAGIVVSGLESNGSDTFFCGGGNSGKLRVVRSDPTEGPKSREDCRSIAIAGGILCTLPMTFYSTRRPLTLLDYSKR